MLFNGREFTFAGVLREEMCAYNILEGSSILPVDYTASAGTNGVGQFSEQESGLSLSQLPDQPNAQFVPYPIDKVVVVSAVSARDRSATRVRSINVFPTHPLELQDLASRAASVTELPTYVGDAGGVYRLIFTSLTEASGVRDLLIPVLLGGLIVFATMLGSVSDREREIYTFSAAGPGSPARGEPVLRRGLHVRGDRRHGRLPAGAGGRAAAELAVHLHGFHRALDELFLHQRHRHGADRDVHGAGLHDLSRRQGLAIGQSGHPAVLEDPQAAGEPLRPGLPVHGQPRTTSSAW